MKRNIVIDSQSHDGGISMFFRPFFSPSVRVLAASFASPEVQRAATSNLRRISTTRLAQECLVQAAIDAENLPRRLIEAIGAEQVRHFRLILRRDRQLGQRALRVEAR